MQPAPVITARPSLVLRVSLLVSYILLVAINTLSSMGYLGPSQADVSGKWQTSLVPAGYAFSIWGVIFTLQGAAAVYAAAPTGYQMRSKCAAVNAVGIGWQLTWLFETAWLLTFPRQTTATFYISSLLLFCGLASICWTVARTRALAKATPGVRPNHVMWLLFVLPTSMNAAWMSVASCLGVDVLAVSQGMPQKQEVILAAALATVVAAVGAAVVIECGDVPWGLVLIWAFAAVLRAHPHVELIRMLSVLAIAVACVCCGYVVTKYWIDRRNRWSEAAAGAGDDATAAMQESLLGAADPSQAGTSGTTAAAEQR